MSAPISFQATITNSSGAAKWTLVVNETAFDITDNAAATPSAVFDADQSSNNVTIVDTAGQTHHETVDNDVSSVALTITNDYQSETVTILGATSANDFDNQISLTLAVGGGVTIGINQIDSAAGTELGVSMSDSGDPVFKFKPAKVPTSTTSLSPVAATGTIDFDGTSASVTDAVANSGGSLEFKNSSGGAVTLEIANANGSTSDANTLTCTIADDDSQTFTFGASYESDQLSYTITAGTTSFGPKELLVTSTPT